MISGFSFEQQWQIIAYIHERNCNKHIPLLIQKWLTLNTHTGHCEVRAAAVGMSLWTIPTLIDKPQTIQTKFKTDHFPRLPTAERPEQSLHMFTQSGRRIGRERKTLIGWKSREKYITRTEEGGRGEGNTWRRRKQPGPGRAKHQLTTNRENPIRKRSQKQAKGSVPHTQTWYCRDSLNITIFQQTSTFGSYPSPG
jgi:hypothetical protein